MKRLTATVFTSLLIASTFALAAPASAAPDHEYGGYSQDEWIAAASSVGSYEPGFLERAWDDPEVRAVIPVSVTEAITRGPVTVLRKAPESGSVALAACGSQRSSWVQATRTHNGPFYAFYRMTVRLNFVYDGCRTWYSSTVVTPTSLGAGWQYDGLRDSANGYEYANGSSYGRTYTERTGTWSNRVFDPMVSYGWISARCHANWNGTHGCSTSSQ